MKSYYSGVILLIWVLLVGSSSGKELPVYKLPHVSTGKVTGEGVDYKVSGPTEGYVPDKETATKIAEVILFRLSSAGEVATVAQRPYTVVQDSDIWWVIGTLKEDFGSVIQVAISKQAGAVLYLEL